MINKRDVVRMKISYPSISSDLAHTSHMYICVENSGNRKEFVKSQTLKPYMINSSIIKHYIDEVPDINRNPFLRTTRIDCDKKFFSENIQYADKMKTTLRPDVSQELYEHVIEELEKDGFISIHMSETELVALNKHISQITTK